MAPQLPPGMAPSPAPPSPAPPTPPHPPDNLPFSKFRVNATIIGIGIGAVALGLMLCLILRHWIRKRLAWQQQQDTDMAVALSMQSFGTFGPQLGPGTARDQSIHGVPDAVYMRFPVREFHSSKPSTSKIDKKTRNNMMRAASNALGSAPPAAYPASTLEHSLSQILLDADAMPSSPLHGPSPRPSSPFSHPASGGGLAVSAPTPLGGLAGSGLSRQSSGGFPKSPGSPALAPLSFGPTPGGIRSSSPSWSQLPFAPMAVGSRSSSPSLIQMPASAAPAAAGNTRSSLAGVMEEGAAGLLSLETRPASSGGGPAGAAPGAGPGPGGGGGSPSGSPRKWMMAALQNPLTRTLQRIQTQLTRNSGHSERDRSMGSNREQDASAGASLSQPIPSLDLAAARDASCAAAGPLASIMRQPSSRVSSSAVKASVTQPVRRPSRLAGSLDFTSQLSPGFADEEEANQQCTICLLELETGDMLRLLPCQHEFHLHCIDSWMRRHRTCPLCRYVLYSDEQSRGGEL